MHVPNTVGALPAAFVGRHRHMVLKVHAWIGVIKKYIFHF
jgi:hypothetical protein